MSYNTIAGCGSVRVGNWQEELVLESTTGVRFAPNPRDRNTQLLTQDRVIKHSDCIKPNEFISNTALTIINPRKHKDFINVSNKSAPKQQILEKKWKEMADAEVKQTNDEIENDRMLPQFNTLHRSSFAKENFKESLVLNDPKYKIQTNSKNYSVESATTYYLHCVEKGKKSLNFPVTYINNTVNPFRKCLAYSADIRVPYCRRAETNENPKPLPKVSDFRALKSIRNKIIHNENCNMSLNDIIIMIWSNEEGETGVISLEKLSYILYNSPLNITLTKDELTALVNSLVIQVPPSIVSDSIEANEISIIEFINILRGSLTIHQQEIIQLVFDKLDNVGKGYITKEDVERLYNYNECLTPLSPVIPSSSSFNNNNNKNKNGLFKPGQCSSGIINYSELYVMDTLEQILENLQIIGSNAKGSAELFDFVEYYWNISAVIDGDEVLFEKLMRKQWKINL